MNKLSQVVGLICLVTLQSGCSSQPIMYPDENQDVLNKEKTDEAVEQCIQLADEAGVSSSNAGDAAKRTAISSAAGAASGAAIGAIGGNVVTGAASGAVGGLVIGLFSYLINSNQPDPNYKRIVEQCLREKGYQPIGWD